MKRVEWLTTLVLTGSIALTGCGPAESPEGGNATGPAAAGSTASGGDQSSADEPTAGASDIVDTAVAAEGFATLVAAVKAAGLVETLKGEGPFTVFAPTDEAFAALPEGTLDDLLKPENKDQLIAILTYHVVPGKVMAADVVGLTSATTVQGSDVAIAVDGAKVTINGANVTTTDIDCSNGVIHVIDAVILPPTE